MHKYKYKYTLLAPPSSPITPQSWTLPQASVADTAPPNLKLYCSFLPLIYDFITQIFVASSFFSLGSMP